MKKLLFLSLALVMTFTLTGCGGNNNSTSDISHQEQQSAAPTESEPSETKDESSKTVGKGKSQAASIKVRSSQAVIEGKRRMVETKAKSTQTETGKNNSTDKNSAGGGTVSNNSDVRIKLTFNNEEVIVKMYDNPTSWDFLTLLPLTLTFEDYAGTEKISYLPRNLSTPEAPSGSNPSVGDLTLYAPWGNLAIFYRDYGYSNGLIKLGHTESGIEKLASITGDFTVKIEKIAR